MIVVIQFHFTVQILDIYIRLHVNKHENKDWMQYRQAVFQVIYISFQDIQQIYITIITKIPTLLLKLLSFPLPLSLPPLLRNM